MRYAGWDWASESHDVTVLDEAGAIVDLVRAQPRRGRDRGGPFVDWASSQLRAICRSRFETTSALVVDRLLAAGHPVVPIHPNAFHATRPRWGASRAKSDPGDSFKLADYLRTDGHRLRRLRPPDRATASSRHFSAAGTTTSRPRSVRPTSFAGRSNDTGRERSRCSPGSTRRSRWTLDDYPTPESAERLGEARMRMFCVRHACCGRRTPAELLVRLRSVPVAVSSIDPGVLAELVRQQVLVLRTLL